MREFVLPALLIKRIRRAQTFYHNRYKATTLNY